MTIRDVSTPVVILRSSGHGGLGILRSLGRLGIAVYVADPDPYTAAFFSRYCHKKFLWNLDSGDSEKSLDRLLEVGNQIGRRAILVPTTDEAAMFVADKAEALRTRFTFPDQKSELVHSLCSKRQMHHLAKRFQVPTANSVFPESRADVLRFLETAIFPVMLKGIFGNRLWQHSGKKMYIVNSERELLEIYDAIEVLDQHNLMLQEYIPGADDTVWMFNGYFSASSDCLIGFTGKKIRQYPVHRGVTSLGICLPNDTVADTTKRFMKAIGYQGILDIGFRYDARDGEYKVLDINPRIGATFRLFVAENAMDVIRALYLDLTGQPVTSGRAQEGRKWMVEDLDLAACLGYFRERDLTLREWRESFCGVEESAYFAADDPLPLVAMCFSNAREIFGRAVRKLRNIPRRRSARTPRSRSSFVQTWKFKL